MPPAWLLLEKLTPVLGLAVTHWVLRGWSSAASLAALPAQRAQPSDRCDPCLGSPSSSSPATTELLLGPTHRQQRWR